MKKRILCMLLLAAMLVTGLPVTATAAVADEGSAATATDYASLYVGAANGPTAQSATLVGLFTAFGNETSAIEADVAAGKWTNKMDGTGATDATLKDSYASAAWGVASINGGLSMGLTGANWKSANDSNTGIVFNTDWAAYADLTVEEASVTHGAHTGDTGLGCYTNGVTFKIDLLRGTHHANLDCTTAERYINGGINMKTVWMANTTVAWYAGARDATPQALFVKNGAEAVGRTMSYIKTTGDTAVTYTVRHANSATFALTGPSYTLEEYEAAKSGRAFYMFAKAAMDTYAVRVYNGLLTEAEMQYNHLIDLLAFYQVALPDGVTGEELNAIAPQFAATTFVYDNNGAGDDYDTVKNSLSDALGNGSDTSPVFTYTVTDGTATITGLVDKNYAGDLVIPATIDGYTVTAIGDSAFEGYTGIASVTVPDSVTFIGMLAFKDCSALASVTLPDSLLVIGGGAFQETAYQEDESNWDNNVLYVGTHLIMAKGNLAGSYTVKEGTVAIHYFAFNGCDDLLSISIPTSVSYMGLWAFGECVNLSDVYYSGTVEEWQSIQFNDEFSDPTCYGAALHCAKEEPEAPVFTYTVSGTNATITGLVDKNYAGDLVIPATIDGYTVTEIGANAFQNCTGITSVVISDGVAKVNKYAFSGCSALESVSIPETVTVLGLNTFEYCTALKEITVPDSIKAINAWTFQGCTALKKVTLSKNLTAIGYEAFKGCTVLDIVCFDNTKAKWEAISFLNNTANPTYYGAILCCDYTYTFLDEDGTGIVSKVTEHYGTEIIAPAGPAKEGHTFVGWEGYTEGMLLTADMAFIAMYEANSYTYTFLDENGTVLKKLTAPYGTAIEAPEAPEKAGNAQYTYTFAGFEGYTEGMVLTGDVTFKATYDSTLNVYTYTFLDEDGTVLKAVSAPYGSVIVAPEDPVRAGYLFEGFDGFTDGMILTENVSFCATYKVDIEKYFTYTVSGGEATITAVDATLAGDVVIPATLGGYLVVKIDDNAFSGCVNITGITIPAGVRSISNTAFTACAALERIAVDEANSVYHSAGNCLIHTTGKKLVLGCKNSVIPTDSTVTAIGSYAFSGCVGLIQLYIPKTVTSIDMYSFLACAGLETIVVEAGNPVYHSKGNCLIQTATRTLALGCRNSVIPADGTVTAIGPYAFSGCTRLTSITVPNGVTTIGEAAFMGCLGLTDVALPDSVVSIGFSAFRLCAKLKSITLPFVGATANGANGTNFGFIFGAFAYTENGSFVPPALKTVVITNTGYIAPSAFYGCKYITSITLPTSVTGVGADAFLGCTGVKSVYYGGTWTEWNAIDFATELSDPTHYGATLYCLYEYTFLDENGTVLKKEAADYGTVIVAPADPTKIGHTFIGWEGYNEGMTLTGDMTFTALYEINQYTYTFEAEGQTLKSETANYGTVITAPTAPDKEGYTFMGWDGYTPGMALVENVTFTAVYELNIYTYTFVANGVTVKSEEAGHGTTVTAPEAPAVPGHTFIGWEGYTDGMTLVGDITFTAIYEVNQYTYTFEADGVTVKSETADYGTKIKVPAAPDKEGYTFIRWEGYTTGMTLIEDLTFTALYEINQYTYIFVADGVTVRSATENYGFSLFAPEAPEKEGYHFIGWAGYTEGMLLTENMVFDAIYEAIEYTYTFVADGETVKSQTAAYGTEIVAPAAPGKSGYTFVGWQGYTEGMTLAGDVSFTAVYKAIKYTYSFVADGKTVKSVTAEAGTTIVAPAAPEKAGYTFKGWKGYTDGMVLSNNISFTAVYEKKTVAEQNSAVYLEYVNLSFRESLCIKYMARGENIGKAAIKLLVWREAQEEYTVETAEQVLVTVGYNIINDKKYLVFDYTGIAMKEMGDVVYARAYANVGGENVYGEVLKYSVLDYIYYCLGKTGPGLDDEEYLDFLRYLMRSGASAQKYFDYKEDRLVTYDFYRVDLKGGTFSDKCRNGLYLEGEQVALFAPATNEDGLFFSHWEDENGNAVTVTDGVYTVGNKNTVLTAVYVEKLYTVTFKNFDGSILEQVSGVRYGETVSLPEAPTRTGYEFLGWYDALTGGNQVGEMIFVTEDVEIFAAWKEKSVQLSCTGTEFYVDDTNTVYFYAKTANGVNSVVLYNAKTNVVICQMKDDGLYSASGDDLPNDGIFSCKLSVSEASAVTLSYYALSDTGYASNQVSFSVVLPLTKEETKEIESVNTTLEQVVSAGSDLTNAQKAEIVIQALESLAEEETNSGKASVVAETIYYDEENGLVSFEYSNGVVGFILLEGLSSNAADGDITSNVTDEIIKTVGDAVIMYSLDDPENSAWLDQYEACGDNWTQNGLITKIRTKPTVQDYKTALLGNELIVIAEHGMYVTRYNWASVYDQTGVIVTTEEVTIEKSLLYSKDLIAKRLYIGMLEDGSCVYCLTPEFFAFYYGDGQLDGSVVYMGNGFGFGFGETVDNGLADALIEEAGAEAVYGYHEEAYIEYNLEMLEKLVAELLSGKTAEAALESAKTLLGDTDLAYAQQYQPTWNTVGHPAATLLLYGSSDMTLVNSDFFNGSFEFGLEGWNTVGDVRVINKLAEFNPTHGEKMAILTTGIGSSENEYLQGTEGSMLLQTFVVPTHCSSITLSYNVVSEEPMEYVGSQYDDQVIIEVLDASGAVINRLTYESVNTSKWYPVSGIDFEGGDHTTYTTYWKTASYSGLATYVGQEVTLRVRIWDMGDSIYDTAVLLDNVTLH